MKIHILMADETGSLVQNIEGYKSVCVKSNGSIDYFDISDSECEEIRALNVVDLFHPDQVEQNLIALLKKIRIGGKIVLSGCDPNILSRLFISNQIDEQKFCEIVGAKNSMSTAKRISKIVTDFGLRIDLQRFTFTNYEITAVRG